MADQTYRLVTRSDFDGLVCAVLLRALGMIDDITFVHPKDVQDGEVEITSRDILTNLPYAPEAHLVFDHHSSEVQRNGLAANHVIIPTAPSAARVVYDHFGGAATFPQISDELMRAVDQADSAAYALEDVLDPQGWTLLNFLMDSRTGLGRFRDFRISNYQLMMALIDEVLRAGTVDEILALPDVVERVQLFREQTELFVAQLHRVCTVRGDLVVVDLRDEDVIHAGNRFMVYALFPQCRVSRARHLGQAEAEHRARGRQVDPGPHVAARHRRADARPRRRRPPQRRHLPGRARRGRRGARRAGRRGLVTGAGRALRLRRTAAARRGRGARDWAPDDPRGARPVRLTRNEDGQLRRLHFFEQRGAVLAEALRDQLLFLRARDARGAVREPWETVVVAAGSDRAR